MAEREAWESVFQTEPWTEQRGPRRTEGAKKGAPLWQSAAGVTFPRGETYPLPQPDPLHMGDRREDSKNRSQSSPAPNTDTGGGGGEHLLEAPV